jgi:hypothetical protein
LIETIYRDWGIVNAHPCITYDLCQQYDIPCPQLEAYVKNRNEVLSAYGITKIDVIVALNSDVNRNKNTWIKMLHGELIKVKTVINEKNTDILNTTDNKNNPISSIFNRILSYYENNIIQNIIQTHHKNVGVPMFDGLLIDKDCMIEFADH